MPLPPGESRTRRTGPIHPGRLCSTGGEQRATRASSSGRSATSRTRARRCVPSSNAATLSSWPASSSCHCTPAMESPPRWRSARRTCRLLARVGARHLVLIQGFTPERERAAGRPGAARPLAEDEWRTMIEAVHRLARVAAEPRPAPLLPSPRGHARGVRAGDRASGRGDRPRARRALHRHRPLRLRGRRPGRAVPTAQRAGRVLPPEGRATRLASAPPWPGRCRSSRPWRSGCSARSARESSTSPASEPHLRRHGFDGWATVEQDRLPTDSGTPADHAAASLRHLRDVGLAA